KIQAALREQRKQFWRKVPLTINGEKIWTDKMFSSVNPSQPDQIVGYAAEADIPEAEPAVAAARAAFEKWRRTSFEERCQLLERVAEILDRRRFELSALEVFEVGKPWAEGDGDIREAIDFCTFYARKMRLIGRPRLTQNVPGEESYEHYWPARRRAGYRAVEFSDGNFVRHGQRRARHGQHSDHETVRAIRHHRRDVDGNLRGSRRAARRIEFSQRQRLGHRRAHG